MVRQEPRWLVIFDNAPDAAAIGNHLPRNSTGHILITSRDQSWRGVARPLPVAPLAREDSINFLTVRTGRTAPSDREAAKHPADELGDLPLGLEQAGAYIDATSKPIADYLRLFRGNQREMIARGEPATGYEATSLRHGRFRFNRCAINRPSQPICSTSSRPSRPKRFAANGSSRARSICQKRWRRQSTMKLNSTAS